MATQARDPLDTSSSLVQGALNRVPSFRSCKCERHRLLITYPKQKAFIEKPPSLNLSAMTASANQERRKIEKFSLEGEMQHQTVLFDPGSKWYPVAHICNLDRRKATGRTTMGRELLVWWDRNGQSWQVWEDKCPYQLAPLSKGRISKKGELQCSRHGWCFAPGSGTCTLAPKALVDGELSAGRRESEHEVATDIVQLRSEGDAVNLADPADSLLVEFLDGEREERTHGYLTEVCDFNPGNQDTDRYAVGGAELVPYRRSCLPRSIAAFSGGSQLVADLTTAWDGLAGRLSPSITSSNHMQLILLSLKLTFAAVNRDPTGGRLLLVNSLSTAYTLADLQMDATVTAAGLLRLTVETGLVGISEVHQQLGSDVGRLLHDCMRFKRTLDQMDLFDEENAKAVRQFCLAYHDIRAITIEFSYRLQQMRHAHDLQQYHRQILALEALQIHAPLAHAIGTKEVSTELEDLAFKVFLPDSYKFLDEWLISQWPDESLVVEECNQKLSSALEHDEELKYLTDSFTISGRLKSRFSIMKKLLKDGRKPEEVYDIVGLRVVLSPKSSYDGLESIEQGRAACYRVLEIVRSVWKEIPGRLKDYVANPKSNGYESLHVAVYLANSRKQPTMELQIRTVVMDAKANDGEASHSLYKGGLTDPEQVQQLKKLMIAAADRAAFSLKELSGDFSTSSAPASEDQVFLLFDKNKDGEISMGELQEVMGELGVHKSEAHELMLLVDTNKDGSVSAEEFADFKKQVRFLQGFDKRFSDRLGNALRALDAGRANEAPYNNMARTLSSNSSTPSSEVQALNVVRRENASSSEVDVSHSPSTVVLRKPEIRRIPSTYD